MILSCSFVTLRWSQRDTVSVIPRGGGSSSVHAAGGGSFGALVDPRLQEWRNREPNLRPSSDRIGSPQNGRKEARSMSAQTHYFENDLLGAFPAVLLFLVLILTALGVVAHVAFA
jgi:hypothetical protein